MEMNFSKKELMKALEILEEEGVEISNCPNTLQRICSALLNIKKS